MTEIWTTAFLATLADPGRLAKAFDSGDGVHPGDAGARTLAGAVDLTIFRQGLKAGPGLRSGGRPVRGA